MAKQAFVLTPYKTPKGRTVKNKFELMVPDATFLAETIKKVAAHEIQAEQRKNNPVQNLIVDNKDAKPFDQAQFRVVALFSDPELMAQAAVSVIAELLSATRYLTGRALSSYEIWVADGFKFPAKKKYGNAFSVSKGALEKLASSLPVGGQIIVVGPMVDYGRKLYWNPMGKDQDFKYKGRARYSAAYDVESGKLSRVRTGSNDTNMWNVVKGRVGRRFPGVKILGRWVTGRSIGTSKNNNRWPGVSISLATKGKLR